MEVLIFSLHIFFSEMSIHVFCSFSNWTFFYYYWVVCVLYVLWILVLHQICGLQVFYLSLGPWCFVEEPLWTLQYLWLCTARQGWQSWLSARPPLTSPQWGPAVRQMPCYYPVGMKSWLPAGKFEVLYRQ